MQAVCCVALVGTTAVSPALADSGSTPGFPNGHTDKEWAEPATLHVESSAPTESDTISSDEPAYDPAEDVVLPGSFQRPGLRSYVESGGTPVYFEAPITYSPRSNGGGTMTTAAASGTWWDGVCTSGESRYSVVKDYPRAKAHSRMERTYARMYCGKKDRESMNPVSEAAFGIRHIRAYHKSQFAKLASWQGSTWGHWMHWAIRWVMSEPGKRTVQNANRFCYQKQFTFVDLSGNTVKRRVIVILGKTGVRIMTSFPRKSAYCSGDAF